MDRMMDVTVDRASRASYATSLIFESAYKDETRSLKASVRSSTTRARSAGEDGNGTRRASDRARFPGVAEAEGTSSESSLMQPFGQLRVPLLTLGVVPVTRQGALDVDAGALARLTRRMQIWPAQRPSQLLCASLAHQTPALF